MLDSLTGYFHRFVYIALPGRSIEVPRLAEPTASHAATHDLDRQPVVGGLGEADDHFPGVIFGPEHRHLPGYNLARESHGRIRLGPRRVPTSRDFIQRGYVDAGNLQREASQETLPGFSPFPTHAFPIGDHLQHLLESVLCVAYQGKVHERSQGLRVGGAGSADADKRVFLRPL